MTKKQSNLLPPNIENKPPPPPVHPLIRLYRNDIEVKPPVTIEDLNKEIAFIKNEIDLLKKLLLKLKLKRYNLILKQCTCPKEDKGGYMIAYDCPVHHPSMWKS